MIRKGQVPPLSCGGSLHWAAAATLTFRCAAAATFARSAAQFFRCDGATTSMARRPHPPGPDQPGRTGLPSGGTMCCAESLNILKNPTMQVLFHGHGFRASSRGRGHVKLQNLLIQSAAIQAAPSDQMVSAEPRICRPRLAAAMAELSGINILLRQLRRQRPPMPSKP